MPYNELTLTFPHIIFEKSNFNTKHTLNIDICNHVQQT